MTIQTVALVVALIAVGLILRINGIRFWPLYIVVAPFYSLYLRFGRNRDPRLVVLVIIVCLFLILEGIAYVSFIR